MFASTRLPPDRRSRTKPARKKYWHSILTAYSCPTAPATPSLADYAIKAVQKLMESGKPIFGICLGHQLISPRHRCENSENALQPSRRQPPGTRFGQRQVVITSQNHGFAVDADTLPTNARITHKSLFDSIARYRTDRQTRVLLPRPPPKPARVRKMSVICLTNSLTISKQQNNKADFFRRPHSTPTTGRLKTKLQKYKFRHTLNIYTV